MTDKTASRKTMALGLAFSDVYGIHPNAWRTGGTDPNAHVDIHKRIEYARTAESGGLDFLFMPDRVFLHRHFGESMYFPLDPIVQLSAVAAATKNIGLIASIGTSFHEPYTIARQLRALDLISGGRAGWNVVPGFEPEAFANYGMPVPDSAEKYERLHEVVQISQGLWGSWKPEAGWPDVQTGAFMNEEHIKPINMYGKHVGSRGPLQLPPSPQGQPVLVFPVASRSGLKPAGMYAGALIAMPNTIEEGQYQRRLYRSAAEQAGRTGDEIKLLAFFAFGLGKTKREALDRRREMELLSGLPERLQYLSMLVGAHISEEQSDTPFSEEVLAQLRPHPRSARAAQAVELAKQGYSPLDILAHGVLDMHPSVVGTAEEVADFLQEWFEAEAVDGFALVPDRTIDGLADFVKHVVPILKARGLRPEEYLGTTLRENLGLPYELGRDKRVLGD